MGDVDKVIGDEWAKEIADELLVPPFSPDEIAVRPTLQKVCALAKWALCRLERPTDRLNAQEQQGFEDAIELAYWTFDAHRAGRDRGPHLTGSPMEERDAFKGQLRRVINAVLQYEWTRPRPGHKVFERAAAIELARKHAKAAAPSYYVEPFVPHAWVVDAILEAGKYVMPKDEASRARKFKEEEFLADAEVSDAWAMTMATKLRDADPKELVGLDCNGLADLRMLGKWILARRVAGTEVPIDRKRFEQAPCYLCEYNGPGYYQPATHPCAARYHAEGGNYSKREMRLMEERDAALIRAEEADDRAKAGWVPIPMRLLCPTCHQLHIDEGEFTTKPHYTHTCQHCGETWRPAIVPTVGVRFLPGFQNETPPAVVPEAASPLVDTLRGIEDRLSEIGNSVRSGLQDLGESVHRARS